MTNIVLITSLVLERCSVRHLMKTIRFQMNRMNQQNRFGLTVGRALDLYCHSLPVEILDTPHS